MDLPSFRNEKCMHVHEVSQAINEHDFSTPATKNYTFSPKNLPKLKTTSVGFNMRHSLDVCTLVPNNSEFLVCLSVC